MKPVNFLQFIAENMLHPGRFILWSCLRVLEVRSTACSYSSIDSGRGEREYPDLDPGDWNHEDLLPFQE
jgi:hypothetical protein